MIRTHPRLELTPRLRREAALCWLYDLRIHDYVTVTTDGTAVKGLVAEADETGIWLYGHDEVEETHHEDEWHACAEHIVSAGHVVPPDTWDRDWTCWPWKYMRHLRPARGRTASARVRAHLRSALRRPGTGGRT